MKTINKDWIKWGLITIGAILILVFLIYGVKAIKKLFGFSKQKSVKVDWSPTAFKPDGGEISPSFSPESIIAELQDVLDRWMLDGSPRCRAYKRLMRLNDNEFIAVVNTYYETFGRTLRSDMNATLQSGCSIFSTQWDEKIYDRMETLNTIG